MKIEDFRNKICWITGASSGIGAALAIALNQLGAYLIISARSEDNLQKVKAGCADAGKVVILAGDMEKTETLPAIALQAWQVFNGLDYVFLNAGFAVRDMVINTDFDLIKKVMTVNYFSNVVITKALLPMMKERGSGCFVVTSSLSGKYGIPKLAAYSASKHALHGFFESLRAEMEKDGIKITMVIPGLVKTNISVHALMGDGKSSGKMQESIETGISPATCARGIIHAVAGERNEALIGGMETYSVLIKRLFPGLFTSAIKNNPIRKLRRLGLFKKKDP